MSTSLSRKSDKRCQEGATNPINSQSERKRYPFNIRSIATASFFIIFAAAFNPSSLLPCAAADGDDIPDRLFEGQSAPQQLAASRVVQERVTHDKLVPAPMEETYWPTSFDTQAKVLNIDTTVNMTIPLNQFYYNPHWRGEDWVPFDQVDLIERSSRLMSTWREYNEANQYKVLNKVNIFFERYSGFGP